MEKEANLPVANNVTRANEEDSSTNKLVPAANAFLGNQQGLRQDVSSIHQNDWEMIDSPNRRFPSLSLASANKSSQFHQSGVYCYLCFS